ncbi:MAG: hypothetical protein P1P82_02865 [Bacteroidales bacterium]|nr:hypothetical protein [Bacteroidales bacterium]
MKKQAPNTIPPLLLLALVFFCASPVSAQETINRNALSFSAGTAVPFDEFAYSRFTYRAGFAQPGVNLDAKIIHYGKRKIFGIYADAGYAYLFFNEKRYLAEYERIFEDEGTTSVTTGGYHFLKAEAGFLIRTIAIRDTRIILQTGVGYTLCRHPYLSAVNSYWGVVNTVNSDLDLQLTGTAGVRVEHTLDEYTGIHLSYQVFACKPSFMDRESYRAVTFYLPVRIQNINFGLTRYF